MNANNQTPTEEQNAETYSWTTKGETITATKLPGANRARLHITRFDKTVTITTDQYRTENGSKVVSFGTFEEDGRTTEILVRVDDHVEALDDLTGDLYSTETREEKALKEAEETGESVEISTSTAPCDDSRRECSTDTVVRTAMPDGTVEVQRHHHH